MSFLFSKNIGRKMHIDTLLDNGQMFDDGKGITITSVLSLTKIKRFLSFSIPEKLSVAEHSWLCGVLVPSYSNFMAENFHDGKYKDTYNHALFRMSLMECMLCHDLEESVIGDIPSPVKIEGLEEVKIFIRKKFANYLDLTIDYEKLANAVKLGMKHIDLLALYVEVEFYFQHNFDRTKSLRKLDEYCRSAIEKFFKEDGIDLMPYVYDKLKLLQLNKAL